jgi:hypothetical protein
MAAVSSANEARFAALQALVPKTTTGLQELRAALGAQCRLVEAERALAREALAPLPPNAVALVFRSLTVDVRLRCRQVCRAWCAFLEERRLWTELDLNWHILPSATGALLAAAAARSGQTLRELNVDGSDRITFAHLLPAVQASGGTLDTLKACLGNTNLLAASSPTEVRQLLAAAPRLRRLVCCIKCTPPEAIQLLCDPACAAVQLAGVWLLTSTRGEAVAPLWPALTAQPMLELVRWTGPLASVALLLASVAHRRLGTVYIEEAGLTPADLPALTGLLTAAGQLDELRISNGRAPLLVGEGVALFSAALRRSSVLASLHLLDVRLWDSADDAAAVLGALTNHPTLETLIVAGNVPPSAVAKVAAGKLLAALLAAGGKLSTLNIYSMRLGDEAMQTIFQAVARSTSLRRLECAYNCILPNCARDHILPAVRANASLRVLSFYWGGTAEKHKFAELAAAEALVAARSSSST